MVLIFNGAQVLVAVTRSLHSAAELTKGNLQAISFCCTGKYVCSGGLYFRHLHPDVEKNLTYFYVKVKKVYLYEDAGQGIIPLIPRKNLENQKWGY